MHMYTNSLVKDYDDEAAGYRGIIISFLLITHK